MSAERSLSREPMTEAEEKRVDYPSAPSPGATPSPFEVTAAVIRGRWAALILWSLFWGEKRFYQVLRDLPGIGRKTLTYQLEELARRGVVGGCGGGRYCPAALVTREQMAVFLTAGFGLTLYGP